MLLVSSCWPIDASPLPSRCPSFSPLSYKKQYTTHLHNIQLFPGKEPLKSNFERLCLVFFDHLKQLSDHFHSAFRKRFSSCGTSSPSVPPGFMILSGSKYCLSARMTPYSFRPTAPSLSLIHISLVQSDVLANLAQTAQRHDLDRDSRGAGACSGGPAAARVVRPARGLRRSRRDRARLGSCRLRRRSRSALARVGYAGGCRLGRSGRARPGCFLIIFHSFLHFPRAAKKPCRCSRAGRFSPRICGNSFLFSFFISGIPRKYLKIKRPGRTMGCPMHKTARRTAL